jgi:crossover junction endodeoxyribonuclease RuvC
MYYLGVDQSLREPGVAIVAPDGRVVVATSTRVGETLRGGERLAAIRNFLLQVVGDLSVAFAALEGPSLKSTHREFDLGEVSGVVRAAIYHSWSVEPLVVAPAQLKLYATGRSGAEKAEIIYAVKGWGFVTDNDNVADAVVLAHIARSVHQEVRCATRHQQDVVVGLRNPKAPTKRLRRKSATNI